MRILILALVLFATTAPQLKWRTETPARGTPAIDEAAIYFLTRAGDLVRVTRGGIETWRRRVGDGSADISGGTVLVADDVVVAGDYDVVAVGRADGAPRWRFHPVDGYGPGLYLGAIADGLVFAGSPSGRVYAIDLRTGDARWSRLVGPSDRSTAFRPVVDGGGVYVGYTDFTTRPAGGVIALDPVSGRELWRAAFPARRPVSPGTGLAGGPLVDASAVVAADAEGIVFAFDRASGSALWSIDDASAVSAGGAEFRALAIARRTLIATSMNGLVTAYDLGTRVRRWQYDGRPLGSPAFQLAASAGLVFVPYPGAGVVALDAIDGREVWRAGAGARGAMWPPLVSGDDLYVASSDGVLAYARSDR
jgi:outer membrane protein assembly factor BamB